MTGRQACTLAAIPCSIHREEEVDTLLESLPPPLPPLCNQSRFTKLASAVKLELF